MVNLTKPVWNTFHLKSVERDVNLFFFHLILDVNCDSDSDVFVRFSLLMRPGIDLLCMNPDLN